MIRNKRGQFYIFTAVLLIAFALGSTLVTRTVTREDTQFNQIYSNYLTEAPYAANDGHLLDFTKAFLGYARTVDVNFGLAYIFSDGGSISIYDGLRKPININNQLSLNDGDVGQINMTNQVVIITDLGNYYFNITNATSLKELFMTQHDGNNRIHVQN